MAAELSDGALRRRYLCEVRMGSSNPIALVVPRGHEVVLCDYCYLYHALPWHQDDAEVLRFARVMVRLDEILSVRSQVQARLGA